LDAESRNLRYDNEVDCDDNTPRGRSAEKTGEASREGQPYFEEPVRLPIEDALDLHAFASKELPSVVEEYLEQCRQAGMSEVRLIHGKGIGAQRAIVRRLLKNHPDVVCFVDAPPQTGGWGATLVRSGRMYSFTPSSSSLKIATHSLTIWPVTSR